MVSGTVTPCWAHDRHTVSNNNSLALFFESPEKADNRAAKRKSLEDHGLYRRKQHSPKPEDLEFDKRSSHKSNLFDQGREVFLQCKGANFNLNNL